MKNIYICDIDGTLASHEGIRSPYDETKVLEDKPLPTCKVIRSLLESGNMVIFISGRTDSCQKGTVTWLLTHVGDYSWELYMRKTGDTRKDTVVKKEMYEKIFAGKEAPIAVFDDRLSVIKMWEELGLFVFNCNQGLKEF